MEHLCQDDLNDDVFQGNLVLEWKVQKEGCAVAREMHQMIIQMNTVLMHKINNMLPEFMF